MKLNNKKIFVFSAGQVGLSIVDFLIDKKKIFPKAIIDNYKKGKYRGINILNSKNIKKNKSICILGIYNNYISIQKLEKELEKKFEKVINVVKFQNIFKDYLFDYWLEKKENLLPLKRKFNEIVKKIPEKKSKELINKIFNFRLSGDLKYYIKPDKNNYFAFKNKLPKDVHVIDCGCFEGLFLDELKKRKIRIKQAYCIEPDKKNFLNLKKKYFKKKNYLFYNRALGSNSKFVGFENKGNASSRINQSSLKKIRTLLLDSKFKKKKINLIKMDVEGFELKALISANKIISIQKPHLLISIYHFYKDLINIFNFLYKFKKSYNFYVRVHEENTFGGLLYCVPK